MTSDDLVATAHVAGAAMPADVRTADAILADVARAKNGGASLQFTVRNAVETTLFQWSLVLLAAGLSWLWLAGQDLSVPTLLLATTALQVAVAAIATALAWRAAQRHLSYASTDRWDGGTGVLQLVALLAATVATGGSRSPLWIVVLLAAAYLATVLVY